MTIAAAAAVIDENTVGVIAILAIFIGMPFAIAYSRLIWKRANSEPARPSMGDGETKHQLLQIQQSIDAIAIEVERLSEGQRFVTKVLAERDAAALPAGKQKRI